MTTQDRLTRQQVGHEELFISAWRWKAWRAPPAPHSRKSPTPSWDFLLHRYKLSSARENLERFSQQQHPNGPADCRSKPQSTCATWGPAWPCPAQAPRPWNGDWPTQLQGHGAFNSVTSCSPTERTAHPVSCQKHARDKNIYKEFVSIYPNLNIQKSWVTILFQIMGFNYHTAGFWKTLSKIMDYYTLCYSLF